MASLSITTININGLLDQNKRNIFFQYCKTKNFNVIFIQETHISTLHQIKEINSEWKGKTYWSFGSSRSCGVGILFNPNFNHNISSFYHDYEGRVIIVNCFFNNSNYRLINIYAPNKERARREFFLSLNRHLGGRIPIFLGGDFNCVENVSLDKIGGSLKSGTIGTKEIHILKQDYGLSDIFRKLNPKAKQFTWHTPDNTVFCRLDRFYLNNIAAKNCIFSDITPTFLSDHSFVTITQKFYSSRFGKSFWKCNTSILNDPKVVSEIQIFFQNAKKSNITGQWWEDCKKSIKQILIKHSVRIKNELKNEINFIEMQIAEYKKVQQFIPNIFITEISDLQEYLKEKLEKQQRGTKIRSRVKYIQNTEKPSSYFFRQEMKNASKKVMPLLKSDDNIFQEPCDILKECEHFYSDLLSDKPIEQDLTNYFISETPKLNPEDSALCDGPITKTEILFALSKMKNNKCPGSDGLPKEFYVRFIHLFIDEFVLVMNQLFSQGILLPSQREGIITLLCKNPEKPEFLKNWRPISLLNVDYKLVSKSLTNRLSKVMSELINIDQTCAVKGRSIKDNIHLLRNIIEYVKIKNINCMFISLDQSKAFDRVSHTFLFQALEAYGFGISFIKWIKLLYSNIFSRVESNGFISDPFWVTRSVRQGCGLSPLLYVLCIELFAIKIRNDPHISGLKLPSLNDEIRISQYADDSTIILTNYKSVQKVFLISELYCKASGALINKDKSSGLWLGNWIGNTYKPVDINWSSSFQRFYGVFLGNGDYTEYNCNNTIIKFCKSIDLLKTRHLETVSKPTIVNLFSCSIIWFSHAVLPLRAKHISKYVKYLFQFIWNNSTERLKRDVMYTDFENGGIRLVHIENKIKAFHINHIFQFLFGDFAKWHAFTEYWIGLQLCFVKPSLRKNNIPHAFEPPEFYKSCLSLFKSFVNGSNQSEFDQIISVKSIYWNLMDESKGVARITKKHPRIDFTMCWKNIHLKINHPQVRDLCWKISHDILPTNEKLYRFNLIKSPKCPMCGQVESFVHLFVFCKLANMCWKEILSLTDKCGFSTTQFTTKLVVFNIPEHDKPARAKEVVLCLINIAKSVIWSIRNLIKFENKKFSDFQVARLLLGRIRLKIILDKSLLQTCKFSNLWLTTPSFVSITNEQMLDFNFG